MRTDRDTRAAGARPDDPLLGRVIEDRYRIEDRIARGGMASVYLAHDLRLDRRIAVKVMHPGMGDDSAFADRFVREARAAAKLTHPNVVAVYDQGEDDGVVFLAMELVAGRTLRDVISAEAPMRPGKALAYLEPILNALAAAHRADLVHRDVKPENVLIGTDGSTGTVSLDLAHSVKVADFGLARAVTAETTHTTSGVLLGTVSYIAPELVVDDQADARADVYSAGVILYELLTGHKPHGGETPIQVAYRHVHDDVPPPSDRVGEMPDYVDALVARATARDRDLRPSDAGVLLHQVHRVTAALREGLDSDPELVDDLALPARRADPTGTDTEPTTRLETSSATEPDQPGEDHETTAVLATRSAPARTTRSRRRGWLRAVTVLIVLAVLGGAAFGGWWLLEGRYTATPALVGLERGPAAERLERAGLDMEIDRAYSDTVPAGEVISSSPARGEDVLDGDVVTVTLSRGVEEYELPALRDQPMEKARADLEELGMEADTTERFSEKIAAGRVMRIDPRGGTVVRPGTEVTMVVSKGRKPIQLEDWTSRSGNRAEKKLSGAGLEVTVERQFSDDVPQGRVISQQPASGTLYRGDAVTLTVSRGPEMIAVPDVRGQGKDAATQSLSDAGFDVQVERYSISFGLGYVMRQEPSSGEARRGSTVTIWVN